MIVGKRTTRHSVNGEGTRNQKVFAAKVIFGTCFVGFEERARGAQCL